ncbi:sodium:galactoside symporter [Epibacterium sp. SM1979]|uniref:Sodium:galactoside symporter n=1 Tax=Tritonibacter litoralis TaxID=2662264 RepID=A0A843YIJ8_9RHOB|nr:MFS transporter [Tritonibacter litoralis]MQQ09628.1 sodium:galactoside symporter [Tritonibacter litoralis]
MNRAAAHYPRVSLYAGMLAAAGLPLYIHLPRFASVELGLDLAALGALLLALRLIDLVQDPLLGWVVDRWPNAQGALALSAALGLSLGFLMLFTLPSGHSSILRLAAILVLLFTAYSLGTILLYGRSASLALTADNSGLLHLAAYREAGILAGVVVAASAPAVFAELGAARDGYPAFGMALAALALLAAVLCRPLWRRPVRAAQALTFAALRQSGALRLLCLGLLNSLPVAITATLFLFFVQDRLALDALAGAFLVLFFLSAGISVPVWTRISRRAGVRRTLLWGMPLAIFSFLGAALLSPGDALGFAVICVTSGAALGADMVLLPALFSITLTQSGLQASLAFGLWSLVGKLGLALAAFAVLPMLAYFGFAPATENPPAALAALTAGYCLIPCILKLGAWTMVWSLPKETSSS